MTEHKEIREFALGAGVLYVAPGRVAESELEDVRYQAGEAEKTCTLRYEYKTKELFDLDGNSAATLKFGENVRIRGTLDRIFPGALPTLILGDRASGGRGALSVLLVCPLPDGEAFRLYLKGGVSTGAVFDLRAGGKAEFDLTFGKEVPVPKFFLSGGGERAS